MRLRPRFWIPIAVLATLIYLLVDVIPPDSLTEVTMHICKRRIQRYAVEHNALPSSLSETREIPNAYNSTKDAWGHEIVYTVDPNGIVTLTSLGKDNKPGGTGKNADMVGIYPSRQPDGKWSDEFVEWTKEPSSDR
jgi:hypothetical protein